MGTMGLFLLCTIVPLAFGLWAQWRVKTTFNKYSQIAPRNGLTGAQAAAAVLRESGLPNLQIRPVAGRLSDHYDPRSRTLNLSADVGQASSLAALGVAAHEAGHAIQDSAGYAPMRIRQTLVPAATIGQSLWILPVFLGLILNLALVALEHQGLLVGDEVVGARKVLNAAALTYVAGFVAALGQLVYFFLLSRNQ